MLTDTILGVALALSLAAALASSPAVRAELRGPALVRPSELPLASPASDTAAYEPVQGTPWPML